MCTIFKLMANICMHTTYIAIIWKIKHVINKQTHDYNVKILNM